MQQYQVSELTQTVKELLEKAFPGLIMVHGEVSELSRSSAGHMYFSLKDKTAKLKSVFFKQYIRAESFVPKNGDKVSAIGEVKTYPPDGTYQLIVRKVVYNTEGEFWKKFEETKNKLGAEGLFDEARKRKISQFPRRIALLTAAGGAAVKDFIVTKKNIGGAFAVDLWAIPVQGRDAAPHIIKAIELAGAKADIYDVLVLTRGGGSLDDLSVFNDESVVRALAASSVPTISAIGHEQDVTICDFASDKRVATPTAAAEFLSRAQAKAGKDIEHMRLRLINQIKWQMQNLLLQHDRLNTKLNSVGPLAWFEREQLKINNLDKMLKSAMIKNIEFLDKRFNTALMKLMSYSPLDKIKNISQAVDISRNKIFSRVSESVKNEEHRLNILTHRLQMTSPERLLSLGYALVIKRGNVLTSVKDVSIDEELEVKLKDGVLDAYITGKKYLK